LITSFIRKLGVYMKLAIKTVLLSLVLMFGTSLIAMEQGSDGKDDKPASLQQQLDKIRREQAAKYAHQKEEKEKEAKRQEHKERKQAQTHKESKEEPVEDGKEEEDGYSSEDFEPLSPFKNIQLTKKGKNHFFSKKPIINPLTKEDKDRLFAQAKEAIEEQRNKPVVKELEPQQNNVITIDETFFLDEGYRLLRLMEQPNFNEYLPQLRAVIRDRDIPERELMYIASWLSSFSSKGLDKIVLLRELLTNQNYNIIHSLGIAGDFGFSYESPSLWLLFVPQFFHGYLSNTLGSYSRSMIMDLEKLWVWSHKARTSDMSLLSRMLVMTRLKPQEIFLSYLPQYIEECSIETGNEAAPDGTTALMFAVGGGYVTLVEELLSRGANPLLTNTHGDNALTVVAIQLQRRVLTFEQRSIFTKIEKLLKDHLSRQAQAVQSEIDLLMRARIVEEDGRRSFIPGLPYELALRIALEAGNHQESILAYLEHNPTLTDHLVSFLRPYALGAIFLLLHNLSFTNKF
jgi:Ankyrin repeat